MLTDTPPGSPAAFWRPRPHTCACGQSYERTAPAAIRCPACAAARAAKCHVRAMAKFNARRKAAK